jgi:ketosteroid isomerase-like protein
MSTAEATALVRSFFEALSSGDLERVGEFFDDETVWTVCAVGIPGAGAHRGRRAIVEDFLGPVRGLFEPGEPKVELTNVVAEGRWVAVEAIGRGRFLDGRPYENQYSFWVEVDGRTIRTIREYMDSQYVAGLGVA